jgi:hypothetical protein
LARQVVAVSLRYRGALGANKSMLLIGITVNQDSFTLGCVLTFYWSVTSTRRAFEVLEDY